MTVEERMHQEIFRDGDSRHRLGVFMVTLMVFLEAFFFSGWNHLWGEC